MLKLHQRWRSNSYLLANLEFAAQSPYFSMKCCLGNLNSLFFWVEGGREQGIYILETQWDRGGTKMTMCMNDSILESDKWVCEIRREGFRITWPKCSHFTHALFSPLQQIMLWRYGSWTSLTLLSMKILMCCSHYGSIVWMAVSMTFCFQLFLLGRNIEGEWHENCLMNLEVWAVFNWVWSWIAFYFYFLFLYDMEPH